MNLFSVSTHACKRELCPNSRHFKVFLRFMCVLEEVGRERAMLVWSANYWSGNRNWSVRLNLLSGCILFGTYMWERGFVGSESIIRGRSGMRTGQSCLPSCPHSAFIDQCLFWQKNKLGMLELPGACLVQKHLTSSIQDMSATILHWWLCWKFAM